MSEDHKEIWIEPETPTSDREEGRLWCQDKVFDPEDYDGVEPTRYMRADICEELIAALEIALPYIQSQNNAEGMLDGLGGRKPRPSDNDLAKVNQALNTAKGI